MGASSSLPVMTPSLMMHDDAIPAANRPLLHGLRDAIHRNNVTPYSTIYTDIMPPRQLDWSHIVSIMHALEYIIDYDAREPLLADGMKRWPTFSPTLIPALWIDWYMHASLVLGYVSVANRLVTQQHYQFDTSWLANCGVPHDTIPRYVPSWYTLPSTCAATGQHRNHFTRLPRRNHAAVLDYLISHGVDMNAVTDISPFPPLYLAIPNCTLCRHLLDRGANPNYASPARARLCTIEGGNSLIVAIVVAGARDILSIITLLIQYGADVNWRCRASSDDASNVRATPLTCALDRYHIDGITLLLEKGASISDAQQYFGSLNARVLSWTYQTGNTKLLEVLCSYGLHVDVDALSNAPEHATTAALIRFAVNRGTVVHHDKLTKLQHVIARLLPRVLAQLVCSYTMVFLPSVDDMMIMEHEQRLLQPWRLFLPTPMTSSTSHPVNFSS